MVWRYTKQLFTVLVVLAVAGLGGGSALLQAKGGKLLSVQSGSMVPAISKGDLVAVTRVPTGELAKGDVVTFISPNDSRVTITHRIVALPSAETKNKFITRGDANPGSDEPINGNAIIGRVGVTIPYAGYGIDFIRKPLGLVLLIYIPALAVIISEMRRLIKFFKAQQPYLSREAQAKLNAQQKSLAKQAANGVKLSAFFILLSLFAALPARAALMSTATLAGNTISTAQGPTAPPNLENQIVLRRVEFHCSDDNTDIENKLPEIFIYNPTNEDINTGGWYLQSRAGRLVTFPGKTLFDSRDTFDVEPDLTDGLRYTGDYLAIFNADGELIDSISWGDDTSYLNPPLPVPADGTNFRRLDLVNDTNTAADWAVSVLACQSD